MQNQLTPGQSNLQQSTNNLQPNNSSLQQSGTPTGSSDVFTVLSQNAQNNGLQVQSAQTDPSVPSQTYLPESSSAVWLVPLLFVAAIVIALILFTRLRQVAPIVEEVEVPPAPVPVPPAKKKKTAKKTTRRKRQTKR